jgi:hypothetical protein
VLLPYWKLADALRISALDWLQLALAAGMLQMVGDWRQEDWRELLSFSITHQTRNLSVDTSQVTGLLPSFSVWPLRVSHPGPILRLVQTRSESASLRH